MPSQGVKHIPAVASMFATAKGILGYDLLELMATGQPSPSRDESHTHLLHAGNAC